MITIHTGKVTMNAMKAVNIAIGLQDSDNDEQYNAAWQYLVDSGMAWTLEGAIGRQAARMIKEGIINSRTGAH
jgi:hypothetical protein